MSTAPTELNARLVSRENLHDSLSIFRVRPDSGRVPAFEPGQFTNLGLLDHPREGEGPKLLRRAFSIASAPSESGEFEFYIQRVGDGHFTNRLFELGEGDRSWLDERVYGNFTLAGVPQSADLVLVATGTGLAPYMSMLRQYAGSGRWRRSALVHSARRAADLGYRGELERVAAGDPAFHYLPTLTREPHDSGWQGLRGRVQELVAPETFHGLTGWSLDPTTAHIFLCGNPEMIADMAERLGGLGFTPHRKRTPGQLHTERYW